ncbi:MAG: hypothetical protein LQ339_000599 [Xanthoria mediterranea]|nr:MAG: hypothetical protein LQ339_000599 [Xanthoria mediterranea]
MFLTLHLISILASVALAHPLGPPQALSAPAPQTSRHPWPLPNPYPVPSRRIYLTFYPRQGEDWPPGHPLPLPPADVDTSLRAASVHIAQRLAQHGDGQFGPFEGVQEDVGIVRFQIVIHTSPPQRVLKWGDARAIVNVMRTQVELVGSREYITQVHSEQDDSLLAYMELLAWNFARS